MGRDTTVLLSSTLEYQTMEDSVPEQMQRFSFVEVLVRTAPIFSFELSIKSVKNNSSF